MRSSPIILALLLAVAAAGPAVAGEGRGGEVGLSIGALFPDEDIAGESSPSPEATISGRFGSIFARRWIWFVDGTYAQIESATGFGTADELTGRTGFELLLRPEARARWFLNGAAGWMNVDYELGGNLDFHRPLGSVGIGQSILWGARRQIRWEWRGDFTLDDARLGGASVLQGRLLVGVVWGPTRTTARRRAVAASDETRRPEITKTSDADGDGIKDRKDRCANTPLGAFVDKSGCPRDSDRDGVYDGIDRCSRTPAETDVDESGCLRDSDGDGVHDGSDACRSTPPGVGVDEWGCPVDRDTDGVPDGLDRCPQTHLGARVDEHGCALDSDGDGVDDGIDLCEDTPPGTRVNRRGCPER